MTATMDVNVGNAAHVAYAVHMVSLRHPQDSDLAGRFPFDESGPRAVGDVCHGVYLRYENCRAELQSDEDRASCYCSDTGARLTCTPSVLVAGHVLKGVGR
jgi:hypothetical protein